MSISGATYDVELGDVARDRISGFQGVVTSITHFLSQCTRVSLSPQGLHDGKPIEAHWFDITHIEVLERGSFATKPFQDGEKTGGPGDSIKPPAGMGR